MDVFNSNGEVYEYENACDLPPAAETVVAVTRAVEEESRDCGGSDTGCRGGEQRLWWQ